MAFRSYFHTDFLKIFAYKLQFFGAIFVSAIPLVRRLGLGHKRGNAKDITQALMFFLQASDEVHSLVQVILSFKGQADDAVKFHS